jgi:CRP-like cAMP-binding protein
MRGSLETIPLFRPLGTQARVALERKCRWKTYGAGQIIVHHQDQSRDVYFVVSGKVRAIIYSPAGKAVTFRDIGPGDMFGEMAAVDGKPRSASVEAIEPSFLGQISEQDFGRAMIEQPQIAIGLLQHAVGQIRVLTTRIFEFSTLAVNNRIQAELLRLARDAGVDGNTATIAPAPKHAEIASRISTHREAVAREISRLEALGLLQRKSRCIIITDLKRLARMVEEATNA